MPIGESAPGIDDKLVRVLQGTNPRQPPVNFYFDNATGLLVRVLRFVDTAVGRVPFQVDYSDYRDVAGVKIPHKWILTWTNGQATSQLTSVQANAAIDASRFARPAPAPNRSSLTPSRSDGTRRGKTKAPTWSAPFLHWTIWFSGYLVSGAPPGTAPLKLRKSRVPSFKMKFRPTALFVPSLA